MKKWKEIFALYITNRRLMAVIYTRQLKDKGVRMKMPIEKQAKYTNSSGNDI